jgi:transposase
MIGVGANHSPRMPFLSIAAHQFTPSVQDLSAKLARRRQLTDMLTAERNRLHTAPSAIEESIQAHIIWLQDQIAILEEELDALIQAHTQWHAQVKQLAAVKGSGRSPPLP